MEDLSRVFLTEGNLIFARSSSGKFIIIDILLDKIIKEDDSCEMLLIDWSYIIK